MTADNDRLFPMDLLRGAAIIGMVLMNAAAVLLPYTLGVDPGGKSGAMTEKLLWLGQFVLLDGKMRALLAMLFGASTLLVIDRAEMDGRDGLATQRRRLLWLLPIGVLHFLLIWDGDILMLLAVAGLIALRLVAAEPVDLLKWALASFALQIIITGLSAAVPFLSANMGDHDALLQRLLVQDIAAHRADYWSILAHRAAHAPADLERLILHALPESLGFVLIGMAMAKGGFFTGQWLPASYRATAIRAYLVGLVPTMWLGIWAMSISDSRVVEAIQFAGALPFRIPAAIGHAALLMWIASSLSSRGFAGRVAAVGRMALSNYLLSALILTTLAYGYGAGLYGRVGRMEGLAAGLATAAFALLWSPLWLGRVGQGPAERLWRSLSRT